MAELVFFAGTVDSGTSTLALQTDHDHRSRGLRGWTFTMNDRAGAGVLSSWLGLQVPAIEVTPDLDLHEPAVAELSAGRHLDHLVCDEAQFYSPAQVDQLARVVDDLGVEVHAFGILTDFRTRMFPGAARLVEVADRVVALQVDALCWCGRRATHDARTQDGEVVVEGEQVVVGDSDQAPAGGAPGSGASRVGYEVLCRRHHRERVTSGVARAAGLRHTAMLPFPEPAQA